jgi:flavin-dependent dehydrogenase
MSDTKNERTDVVVIGGGPAGSAASTLIAQKGYRVRLFERDHFPRFHIGESLIPDTFWVLRRLGMVDKLRKGHFVKKYSVQFVGESGRLSEPFYFWDHKPHEASQTWQVLRSEFDQQMLENAREHGVDVNEGVRVLEVLFDNGRATGVRFQREDGTTATCHCQVVVDASGQSTMIQSHLKLREWDPELKKAALWTYWEGAQRDTGKDEGATIVLQTKGKKGWFWYIPLHENVISVGVVAAYDYLLKDRGTTDLEAIYSEEVERCPAVKQRIAMARRVGPFRVAKEYSYRSRQLTGDGWVLVGDALGFLDPLYSSGVLLALHSAQLAADAIVAGLANGDTSAEQLGHWSATYLRGMQRMRRLVCEYYNGLSFGRFVKRYPHLKGPITDLLIGDMFRDELDEVFVRIDEFRAEMAARGQEAMAVVD